MPINKIKHWLLLWSLTLFCVHYQQLNTVKSPVVFNEASQKERPKETSKWKIWIRSDPALDPDSLPDPVMNMLIRQMAEDREDNYKLQTEILKKIKNPSPSA